MSGEGGGTAQMRERILAAGSVEFAAYGLAGARVDRIAATASVNKNSIYRYFPSKEDIFAAVLHRNMEQVRTDVPFSPNDLPGFAARLFDYALDHPQLMRLATWAGLERPEATRELGASMSDKYSEISAMQAAGRITEDVTPAVIFAVITAIGTAWSSVNPFWSLIDSDAVTHREALRASIVRVVERAFTPGIDIQPH